MATPVCTEAEGIAYTSSTDGMSNGLELSSSEPQNSSEEKTQSTLMFLN